MVSDKITGVYDFIYKIDKRVSILEKDTVFIESKIQKVTGEGKGKYVVLNQELSDLKNTSESLRNELKKCQMILMNISKDLKSTLKKDQIEQVTSAVDEIKFEEFISRKELHREI
jgi:hypothetical protein